MFVVSYFNVLLGDTNNISLRVMSAKLLFTLTVHAIIFQTIINYIDQSDNNSCHVLRFNTSRFGRVNADWFL